MAEAASPQPPTESDPGTGSVLRRVLKAALWFLWSPYFKIMLAVGIMAFLYFGGRLELSRLRKLTQSWPWVAVAGLLMLPSFLVSSVRFWIVLNALDLPCRFRQALSWTMIGCFFDAVMPLSTGGDLIKGVYVWHAFGKGRRGMAVLCVLLDRLIGLSGLFFLALTFCWVSRSRISGDERLAHIPLMLLAICLVLVAAFAVFSSRWFMEHRWRKKLMSRLPRAEKFEKIYQGFAGLRRRPLTLLAVLGLSIVNHAIWCSVLVVLGKLGLGLGFDLLAGLVVMPLALFLNTFGVAGGFGVGELAFDYLFEHFLHAAPTDGSSLALVFHLLYVLVRVIGLPFYLAAGKPLPQGEIDLKGQGAAGTRE